MLQDPSSGACTDELVQLNASNWNWSVVQVRGLHVLIQCSPGVLMAIVGQGCQACLSLRLAKF